VRRRIEERGGECEILDIGPSRKLVRPQCIPVVSGWDYLAKLFGFARAGFAFHCHINGEYFRGLLLALAACLIGRMHGRRCVTTFHAGTDQPFFSGWWVPVTDPLFRVIFALSQAVICNNQAVKLVLNRYTREEKVFPVPAFSIQYLSYQPVEFNDDLRRFMSTHAPLLSTYLCFRAGFFLEVVIEAVGHLVKTWPNLGLVIVGTGARTEEFVREIERLGLKSHFFLAGDMQHDGLMTLLSRTTVHLRTPVTDGVSATVLQALALGVPVVASENGTRPPSVVTYRPTDARHLAERMGSVLTHREEIISSIECPRITDTVEQEVLLLTTGNVHPTPCSVEIG
jgi:glycosyltransferase involved in cell wall biosynthesis